jgi:hypothetical protein
MEDEWSVKTDTKKLYGTVAPNSYWIKKKQAKNNSSELLIHGEWKDKRGKQAKYAITQQAEW